jgi:hypothetical protein
MPFDVQFRKETLTGWLTGLLAPPAALMVFLLLKFPGQSPFEVLQLFASRRVLPHVISLSVIINLVFFFGFLRMNRDASARGVLGATFLYVFVAIFLKFF